MDIFLFAALLIVGFHLICAVVIYQIAAHELREDEAAPRQPVAARRLAAGPDA